MVMYGQPGEVGSVGSWDEASIEQVSLSNGGWRRRGARAWAKARLFLTSTALVPGLGQLAGGSTTKTCTMLRHAACGCSELDTTREP